MKTGFWTRTAPFLACALALSLLLAACERPLQEGESTQPPGQLTPGGGLLTPPATNVLVTPILIPNLTPGGPVLPTPAPTQAGGPVSYVVQPGDNLEIIAQQYNVALEALAAANNLAPDAVLQVGQTILVPVGQVVQPTAPAPQATAAPGGEQIYVVQPGDNLFRIAIQFGLTYQELAAYNGITDPTFIEPGQEIRIPPTP
ncbi:MAG: LysM peptidoglycan-binding domain-containing protein [Candidatus Promineifilaceae bacterium]